MDDVAIAMSALIVALVVLIIMLLRTRPKA
jgi:hypothetical protein